MPKFEINVSAYLEVEFDEKPTADQIIAYYREEPGDLFLNLVVDSVDEAH